MMFSSFQDANGRSVSGPAEWWAAAKQMVQTAAKTAGQGQGYTCNANICYGSDGTGEMHTLFKSLQMQLNRLAPAAGAPAIATDGFLGVNTVNLARAVAAKNDWLYANKGVGPSDLASKESLAARARAVATATKDIADSLGMPPPRELQTTAATQPPPGPGFTPGPGAGAGAGPVATKSNWIWWTVGGLAVVALAGVGVYVYKRSKTPGAARPRPRTAVPGPGRLAPAMY